MEKNNKAPVIQLASGFTIDDSVLEKPTMLIGQVSSGKSYLLRNAIMPRIFSSMRTQDAAVIFATKREMIDGFYHPENGDLLLLNIMHVNQSVSGIFLQKWRLQTILRKNTN